MTVVDYDPAYVSEARFPTAKRIVLEGGNFDALEQLDAAPEDYVCVLTRGHMFDPEGCVWATRHHVHYVGMMGCAGKNDRVRELVLASGATEEDWERQAPHRPEVRGEDARRAGHRHRRRARGRALPPTLQRRSARTPREEPGPLRACALRRGSLTFSSCAFAGYARASSLTSRFGWYHASQEIGRKGPFSRRQEERM